MSTRKTAKATDHLSTMTRQDLARVTALKMALDARTGIEDPGACVARAEVFLKFLRGGTK